MSKRDRKNGVPTTATSIPLVDPHAMPPNPSFGDLVKDADGRQDQGLGGAYPVGRRGVGFVVADDLVKVEDVGAGGHGWFLSGVGFAQKPPRFLKPGDGAEVEVDGIGILRNPVKAEA